MSWLRKKQVFSVNLQSIHGFSWVHITAWLTHCWLVPGDRVALHQQAAGAPCQRSAMNPQRQHRANCKQHMPGQRGITGRGSQVPSVESETPRMLPNKCEFKSEDFHQVARCPFGSGDVGGSTHHPSFPEPLLENERHGVL